ncbi:MAG: hypothetical protein AAF742_00760 [Pseudomonadota bacterium]
MLTLSISPVFAFKGKADQHSIRANEMNFFCASQGGLKDGECGFIVGCIISEAVGLFDCYQIIDGRADEPINLSEQYGFDNPFVIDELEQFSPIEIQQD